MSLIFTHTRSGLQLQKSKKVLDSFIVTEDDSSIIIWDIILLMQTSWVRFSDDTHSQYPVNNFIVSSNRVLRSGQRIAEIRPECYFWNRKHAQFTRTMLIVL